jgi:alpha-glucosidase
MDTIPIFIKGGTILPMEEGGEIFLHIYPGAMGLSSSHLYSDDGDGYGAWRLDYFHADYHDDFVAITMESDGSYSFPYAFINVVVHGKKLTQVISDNIEVPIQGNTINIRIFTELILTYE